MRSKTELSNAVAVVQISMKHAPTDDQLMFCEAAYAVLLWAMGFPEPSDSLATDVLRLSEAPLDDPLPAPRCRSEADIEYTRKFVVYLYHHLDDGDVMPDSVWLLTRLWLVAIKDVLSWLLKQPSSAEPFLSCNALSRAFSSNDKLRPIC